MSFWFLDIPCVLSSSPSPSSQSTMNSGSPQPLPDKLYKPKVSATSAQPLVKTMAQSNLEMFRLFPLQIYLKTCNQNDWNTILSSFRFSPSNIKASSLTMRCRTLVFCLQPASSSSTSSTRLLDWVQSRHCTWTNLWFGLTNVWRESKNLCHEFIYCILSI